MALDTNRIGKNIKRLRQAYGETQQELADAINVSASAVANYERGDRDVDLQKLQAIATRYRYPLEQLIRTNLFSRKPAKLSFCFDEIIKLLNIMLPLLCSEEALENKEFLKAYQCHLKIRGNFEKCIEPRVEDIETSFDFYVKSYVTSQIMESAANLVNLVFLGAIVAISGEDGTRMSEAFRSSYITGESVDNKYFTRRKNRDAYAEREKKKIIRELNESILPIIQDLSSLPKWVDLAHYYLALRYFTGMVNNGISDDWNSAIGMEMMRSLLVFKNRYARRLLKYPDKK